jgi:hypothetical protein
VRDFGLHPIAHGGLDAGGERGRATAGTWRRVFVRLLGRPLNRPARLGGGHGCCGLSDLAGQMQAGGLRHLMLAREEVRRMMSTQLPLDMPTQRRGLVAGALDHGDIPSDQGFLERLRPGRRLTIRRVL